MHRVCTQSTVACREVSELPAAALDELRILHDKTSGLRVRIFRHSRRLRTIAWRWRAACVSLPRYPSGFRIQHSNHGVSVALVSASPRIQSMLHSSVGLNFRHTCLTESADLKHEYRRDQQYRGFSRQDRRGPRIQLFLLYGADGIRGRRGRALCGRQL